MTKHLVLALVTLCFTTSAFSAELATIAPKLEALLAAHAEADEPGYAVGIVAGGKLAQTANRGVADLSEGTPISAKTVFNLASLSKQFTGAAVAREIHQGRLGLESPLRIHVPDFPAYADPVRVDHLVFMTSGLAEYYDVTPPAGVSWRGHFTLDNAVAAVGNYGALRYAPGTRWTYSNINYMLLTKVVEHTSGIEFPAYMQQYFFGPLGMEQSLVHGSLNTPIMNLAKGYESTLLGWRAVPRRAAHYGGSGVFSSIADLAKWDAALRNHSVDGPGFTEVLLSTKRFEHNKDNDAFGIVHGEHQGHPTHWYAGNDFPYTSHMLRFPKADVSIYVLSNREGGRASDVARAIADLLIEAEIIQ